MFTLYQRAFHANTKIYAVYYYEHLSDLWLSSAASLRYKSRADGNQRVYLRTEALFGVVLVPAQKLSSRVWTKPQLYCERFEPRNHIKSRLSLIVRVNVVLNSPVVVDSDWPFDNLFRSHRQSQTEFYHISWWYYTLVIDLISNQSIIPSDQKPDQ